MGSFSRMLACDCAAAFATVVGLSSTSQADEGALLVHLEWVAPPPSAQCPTREATIEAVESRLLRRVFVKDTRAHAHLSVAIEKKSTQWSALLELKDANGALVGTRQLESKSSRCNALADVLPVVVALLVDASQSYIRLELPSPHPVEEEPALPRPKARAKVNNLEPALRVDAPHWGWVAQTELNYGLLPGLAIGGAAIGLYEPLRELPIELSFGYLPPTTNRESYGLRISLVQIGARICPALLDGGIRWAACAGVSVGSLQATGRGFDVNKSRGSSYLDARASTLIDVPIARPWFVRVEMGAVFPLIRRALVGEPELEVRTLLHRPAVCVPQVAIGMGVGFR